MRLAKVFLFLAALSLGAGCTDKTSGKVSGRTSDKTLAEPFPRSSETPENKDALRERGRAIYVSSCIACHNSDPSKDSSVGPAIAGSSLELISARVLRAGYPTGYKPKRETAQMPALPHLGKELTALHAYLNGQ